MNEKRNWLGPYIPEGSFFKEFVQQVKLVYNLMLDGRVHPITKLIPIAALAYLVFPADIVIDLTPVLGQVDDVAILLLGFRFFLEFAPDEVVQEHLRRLTKQVRETWEVKNEGGAEGAPPPNKEVVEGEFKDLDDKRE